MRPDALDQHLLDQKVAAFDRHIRFAHGDRGGVLQIKGVAPPQGRHPPTDKFVRFQAAPRLCLWGGWCDTRVLRPNKLSVNLQFR